MKPTEDSLPRQNYHPTVVERKHILEAHIQATTVEDGTATGGVPPPPAPTRLRFGTPDPPILLVKSGGGTSLDKPNIEEHQNRFAPLRQ